MSNLSKGILFSLLAAALFTPIYAAGKFSAGLFPALALVTVRYLGGFLTISIIALFSRVPRSELRSPKPLDHMIRALLGAAGGMSAIYAASVIPIAYATAIGLTRGMFVIFLAGLVLKEVIEKRHWIACIISIAGALLIVAQSFQPGSVLISDFAGILSAFAGALFIALEVLFVKVISRRENALSILLYTNGFGALILTIVCLLTLDVSKYVIPELLPFFILGPLAITGQFCNIKAYRLVDASVLAPVSYSIIIFSTLLGVFAFGEVPTFMAGLGGVFIVLGGVVATMKIKRGS